MIDNYENLDEKEFDEFEEALDRGEDNPGWEVPRGFSGAHIPRELYLDRKVSWNEKLLLIEINLLDLANKKNTGCFATNKYLAWFLNFRKTKGKNKGQWCEKIISEMISHLIFLKYLEVLSFDGRRRFLRTTLTYLPHRQADKEDQKVVCALTPGFKQIKPRGSSRLNPRVQVLRSLGYKKI